MFHSLADAIALVQRPRTQDEQSGYEPGFGRPMFATGFPPFPDHLKPHVRMLKHPHSSHDSPADCLKCKEMDHPQRQYHYTQKDRVLLISNYLWQFLFCVCRTDLFLELVSLGKKCEQWITESLDLPDRIVLRILLGNVGEGLTVVFECVMVLNKQPEAAALLQPLTSVNF